MNSHSVTEPFILIVFNTRRLYVCTGGDMADTVKKNICFNRINNACLVSSIKYGHFKIEMERKHLPTKLVAYFMCRVLHVIDIHLFLSWSVLQTRVLYSQHTINN